MNKPLPDLSVLILRRKRLAWITEHMDDGMGVIRDDYDENEVGRYAHFYDGSYTRNVTTDDSSEPPEAYEDWKRLLTWDLDDNTELWPASPVDLAVGDG